MTYEQFSLLLRTIVCVVGGAAVVVGGVLTATGTYLCHSYSIAAIPSAWYFYHYIYIDTYIILKFACIRSVKAMILTDC